MRPICLKPLAFYRSANLFRKSSLLQNHHFTAEAHRAPPSYHRITLFFTVIAVHYLPDTFKLCSSTTTLGKHVLGLLKLNHKRSTVLSMTVHIAEGKRSRGGNTLRSVISRRHAMHYKIARNVLLGIKCNKCMLIFISLC